MNEKINSQSNRKQKGRIFKVGMSVICNDNYNSSYTGDRIISQGDLWKIESFNGWYEASVVNIKGKKAEIHLNFLDPVEGVEFSKAQMKEWLK